MELYQSDKKHLIYENQIEQSIGAERLALHSDNELWFWSERLVLVAGKHTNELWHFQAFDLLTNEARPISFSKSDSQSDEIQVFPLVKNYGFIVESSDGHYQLSLVEIHWKTGVIQVFEQFERHGHDDIFVDKIQPSKFVLRRVTNYEVCKLNGGEIKFGDIHTADHYFEHYSNDKLFVFDRNENEDFVIQIYDLLLKKSQSIQVKALPGYDIDHWSVGWIKDRVYTIAESRDENKFEIAWTDLETKRFTLLDFTMAVPIQKLNVLNGKLIAYGKRSDEQDGVLTSTVKIHSIPMHRPHSLRQMAWLLVVQQMKNSGVIDPYKEASRYLPFNTDLRAPWYTDEVDSSKEASKNQGVMDESEKPDTDDADDSSQDEVPPKRYKPN